MAALRVFVSSTCVDLGSHREQIRALLIRMGYDPVMSDFSDVLYDPRKHTHTSCIREVSNSDMVILLIGSRFGGEAVPEALDEINFTASTSLLENSEEKYSITQLEALKAIDLGIPLLTFVDSKVYSDHHTYIRNKKHDFIDKIEFPSIQKPKTAKYIFDFISFLTHMSANNAILPYASFADIEISLVKQWAGLFQTLLRESREKQIEARKTDAILEQIEGLKTAVLQTFDSGAARNVARSVLKFKVLADFLLSMRAFAPTFDVADYTGDFEDLLSEYGVLDTLVEHTDRVGPAPRTILLLEDGRVLRVRISSRRFENFPLEWRQFTSLDRDTKLAVLEGVEDSGPVGLGAVQIISSSLIEFPVEVDDPTILNPDASFQSSTYWTDERSASLIAWWEEGKTASEIAEALGGVSRNAVIGKAHRLGLKARQRPAEDVAS